MEEYTPDQRIPLDSLPDARINAVIALLRRLRVEPLELHFIDFAFDDIRPQIRDLKHAGLITVTSGDDGMFWLKCSSSGEHR